MVQRIISMKSRQRIEVQSPKCVWTCAKAGLGTDSLVAPRQAAIYFYFMKWWNNILTIISFLFEYDLRLMGVYDPIEQLLEGMIFHGRVHHLGKVDDTCHGDFIGRIGDVEQVAPSILRQCQCGLPQCRRAWLAQACQPTGWPGACLAK